MQEVKDADAGEELYLSTSRAAVLADAEALLTCYGVGEESGAELLHAVVELCFTSSVRFLQPGLLLKVLHHTACVARLGKAHVNSKIKLYMLCLFLAAWSPPQGAPPYSLC